MLKATKFRILNFRNIDDSGWIKIGRVTAFVGRNESGKTALLKALHKFNPATPEPYDPQREFPRDRYIRDFNNPEDWPVCSVAFEIENIIQEEIGQLLDNGTLPKEVVCTRYYDGSLDIEFDPAIEDTIIKPTPIVKALKSIAATARRLPIPTPEQEQRTQKLRTELAEWATEWQAKAQVQNNLCTREGANFLSTLRKESEKFSNPQTAEMIEQFHSVIDPIISDARKDSIVDQAREFIERRMPVFIYFENYGILDSALYLPRFLEDLRNRPHNERIRTINAMFKHVGLSPQEITEFGQDLTQQLGPQIFQQQITDEIIKQEQQKKEVRAIKLNSATLDITRRFNNWYGQRRHTIEYQADGDYFRIWIADDRRPGVKIELESRSKGFQWFFSFYLIFLVESDEGHRDAILLLDEPGLNLHSTAQQELIAFFEKLAERNQLLYTTHSPFLIDGENLHRVRPVTEDEAGHSTITAEIWPKDRETIFPLQAAAGYAMLQGLFQHKRNLLVEGMSDYYYLHALSKQCQRTNREFLPEEIYITPCGGTKLVGYLASLFLGQNVRPLVLFNGNDAKRTRQNALIKDLYSGHDSAILMLDEAINRQGPNIEIEDILGEEIVIGALQILLRKQFTLNDSDCKKGSLTDQIKSAAQRKSIELPNGWKASIANQLVAKWAEENIVLPDEVLNIASMLFAAVNTRFKE